MHASGGRPYICTCVHCMQARLQHASMHRSEHAYASYGNDVNDPNTLLAPAACQCLPSVKAYDLPPPRRVKYPESRLRRNLGHHQPRAVRLLHRRVLLLKLHQHHLGDVAPGHAAPRDRGNECRLQGRQRWVVRRALEVTPGEDGAAPRAEGDARGAARVGRVAAGGGGQGGGGKLVAVTRGAEELQALVAGRVQQPAEGGGGGEGKGKSKSASSRGGGSKGAVERDPLADVGVGEPALLPLPSPRPPHLVKPGSRSSGPKRLGRSWAGERTGLSAVYTLPRPLADISAMNCRQWPHGAADTASATRRSSPAARAFATANCGQKMMESM